jgi:hypothetical protein
VASGVTGTRSPGRSPAARPSRARPGRERTRLLAAAALAALVPTATARAHPGNVAYADVEIGRQRVQIALSANLFELDLVLGLDRNLDARVDAAEVEGARARIVDYLARAVTVAAGDETLRAAVGPLRLARSSDGREVLEARLTFEASRPVDALRLRIEPLTELGTDHTTLATIRREGRTTEFAFRPGIVYSVEPGPLARFAQFLRLGVVHIFTGYDHVAFLVGLLLAGGRLGRIVAIVTAFTAAHSVTLSLAALEVVRLPGPLVEATIALSIVYVAAEHLVGRGHDRRVPASFVFGLVHGFGFATVLIGLGLPAAGLVASLLAFNLGVELGQLAIVLAVVPLFRLLARTRADAVATRSLAGALLVLGLLWLVERVR